MGRIRSPLIVEGVKMLLDAPGLKQLKRPNGRIELRWVCSDEARRHGYPHRTIRLHGDLTSADGAALIAARCRTLWNEMLEWMREGGGGPKPVFDCTLKSLIALYQTGEQSPYRNVRQNTQRGYDDWCRALNKHFGARRIDRLGGQDLRRWYNVLAEPAEPGGKPRLRLAQACVRSMLGILLNYGVELSLPGCLELAQVLERMTFKVPRHLLEQWQAMKPSRSAMTFAQAEAIVEEGLARGTKRHRSVAIGVAIQFELTLAQIDVIGTWEKLGPQVVTDATIMRGDQTWRPGLRYEDFLPGMTLDMTRSKTAIGAVFDLTCYPLIMRALAAIPEAERRGPVAIDDNGKPFLRRYYIDLYRELADARGVPAGVWNMLARHGGATEAKAAGVEIGDITDHLQKTDVEGTRRNYVEGRVETTRRVATARVAHRKKRA